MASGSFQLFVNQVRDASSDLKVKVLPVLYDLLMVHDEFQKVSITYLSLYDIGLNSDACMFTESSSYRLPVARVGG